jgi:uncharacterized protein YggU (UPF0235/DUF167 family)
MDPQEVLKNFQAGALKIKVKACADRNEVVGALSDGTVKINLRAKREKGKANLALIKFLSNYLKLNSSQIKIISGFTSSTKLLIIKK